MIIFVILAIFAVCLKMGMTVVKLFLMASEDNSQVYKSAYEFYKKESQEALRRLEEKC